ncbi:FAD/FMN-dependent dehydrogenase [Syntrophotalea carbinolica DSM 2380]|uniref:D-lactate dehydrogenase (cytochrome) n=1 Tax=Syntrophotalea carbinolica (strain DSM 2380 / NBRC 103641 / GraBd1) TaxID=338963 RepID=Q3A1S7_SYNC1|nr:FAD-binding oxidoreductase [Syntrophotalea carbinolica]ABA89680.1 FAD/FMN-dependent dehydrogenase [Syntrophotalea carbinolica DSM 2380]
MRADYRKLLADKLRGRIAGRVLADGESLRPYTRDQSIYRIEPLAAALPEHLDDVLEVVRLAAEEGLPLTARGGGSGTAGSALGEGIVMALPRNDFWGRLDGFAASGSQATVHCAAGVLHNDLQTYLKQRGYFLPADVSSADISRIGGNIATKASGPHALKYGSIDRFLERVVFVSDRGELVDSADPATIPLRFTRQLADLQSRIRSDAGAVSMLRQRQGRKIASGYNLFAFLADVSPGQLIAQLLAGSVGSLGVLVGATLRGEIFERQRAAVLLYFSSMVEAGRAVTALRNLPVAAIEIISRETVEVLQQHTELPSSLAMKAHLLLVELNGPDCMEQVARVEQVLQRGGFRMRAPLQVARAEAGIEQLWTLRKQILWLIRHPEPHLRALSVVNDVGVPPEHLSEFIHDVQNVFARQQLVALIYGHAGSGNLHLRPLFDVTLPDLPGRIRQTAEAVYEVVFRYGGTISAEHGMGRLRAPYLQREWGPALYGYMRELKEIFDPQGLFNPGVVFSERPITEHLRDDLADTGGESW